MDIKDLRKMKKSKLASYVSYKRFRWSFLTALLISLAIGILFKAINLKNIEAVVGSIMIVVTIHSYAIRTYAEVKNQQAIEVSESMLLLLESAIAYRDAINKVGLSEAVKSILYNYDEKTETTLYDRASNTQCGLHMLRAIEMIHKNELAELTTFTNNKLIFLMEFKDNRPQNYLQEVLNYVALQLVINAHDNKSNEEMFSVVSLASRNYLEDRLSKYLLIDGAMNQNLEVRESLFFDTTLVF